MSIVIKCPLCGGPARAIEGDEGTHALVSMWEEAMEDASDASEASWQAAFWRARAVSLGAKPTEYREHVEALEGS